MSTGEENTPIRVLIADDDVRILRCYQEAFADPSRLRRTTSLETLEAELFDGEASDEKAPVFDVVACSQGEDAVSRATTAQEDGAPFDVVILDVRMPPGISGVEAGSAIRALNSDAPIIFVSGFSDVPRDELETRVPPPDKLHYFYKPLSFTQLAADVADMVRSG